MAAVEQSRAELDLSSGGVGNRAENERVLVKLAAKSSPRSS